ERRPVIQDRVIRGNRTKTNERYRVRISESLATQLEALGEPAFPGTYTQWRERVNKVIKDAGVKTTPHGFRHYTITEWLSAGVHVDDVADMVGTSSKEIRKTYRHWIKEAEDRLDEVQREAWLKMGLDGADERNVGKSPERIRLQPKRLDLHTFELPMRIIYLRC